MVKRLCLCLILGCVTTSGAFAQAVPQRVSFTGNLNGSGGPVTGAHDFVFALFDASTAGSQVWTESRPGTPVVSGLVYADLGAVTPLTPSILNGAPLWLEIKVDSVTMSPRLAMQSVPYAIRAAVASSAETLGVLLPSDVQRRVTGVCASGIASIDASGVANCATGGSGINALNAPAGSGLSASISTGTATISLQGCPANQLLKSNGAAWSCQGDNDTGVNSASGGTGLNVTLVGRALTVAPVFGSTPGTIAQGNDPRFTPPPGVAGRLLFDNGSAWVSLPQGPSGWVLMGGPTPAWSATSSITSIGTLGTLDVATINLSGQINVAPRNSYVSLHASAFTPRDSAVTYSSNWGGGNDRFVNSASGTDSLAASLSLPQGANVTNLSCRVTDNDSTYDVYVGISEMTGNNWVCNPVSSSGASVSPVRISANCSGLVIDNINKLYAVRFFASGKCASGGSVCALFGCTVTYSVTSLP